MARFNAGYLRKSVVTQDKPGDASRDVQLAAVQELAGPNVRLYDADWGVSGNGKSTQKRTDYLRLKADIKADRVGLVAAYSLSRLGRSLREVYDLLELCIAHDTKVVTKVDNIDMTTASGRAMVGMLMVWVQMESELASERTKGAVSTMRAKGSKLGHVPIGFRGHKDPVTKVRAFIPDGSADHIIEAYKEAGTLSGAAHLLAERGIKSPRSSGTFSAVGLRGIIERVDPTLLPPRRASGVRRKGKHVLSGLVVCGKCERLMTPDTVHMGLYCSNGRMQGVNVHGPYTVPYRRLMPLIEAEAATYMPAVVTKYRDDRTEQRKALTERKARVGEAYEAGAMDLATMKAKVAALDADLSVLGDVDEAIESLTLDPAGVDWTLPPGEVNTKLHQLFSRITLNPSYQSLRFAWKLPDHYHDQAALDEYERQLSEATA